MIICKTPAEMRDHLPRIIRGGHVVFLIDDPRGLCVFGSIIALLWNTGRFDRNADYVRGHLNVSHKDAAVPLPHLIHFMAIPRGVLTHAEIVRAIERATGTPRPPSADNADNFLFLLPTSEDGMRRMEEFVVAIEDGTFLLFDPRMN